MPSSDVIFSERVKAIQTERGSRAMFAGKEAAGGFNTDFTDDLVAFIGAVTTAYLATASASGQPYAQHRGDRRVSSASARPT